MWSTNFGAKLTAEFLELSTIIFLLPLFVFLPYETANAIYTRALVSLKSATEFTALVAAIPFAFSVALFSLPAQAFYFSLFSTGVVLESVWYLGESLFTGTNINELVPKNV